MQDVKKLRGLGFNVIPLRSINDPKSKMPSFAWKQYQTEKYTKEIPKDVNIGIITGTVSGNIMVLDLDDPSLYKEFAEFHDKTFIVKTGKRGHHIYFHYRGLVVNSKKLFDKDKREIDIKAEGGYVVGPGSIHYDTKNEYEIICDKPIMTVSLESLKQKLLSLGFMTPKRTLSDLKSGSVKGDRNDSMFRYACYLIRESKLNGIPLRHELDIVNAKNDPPMHSSEMDLIVQSALDKEGSKIKDVKALATITALKNDVDKYLETKPDIIDLSRFQEYTKIFSRDTIESMFNNASDTELKFTFGSEISIADIRPDDMENIPVTFNAMIIACGDRETYTKDAMYMCDKCGIETLQKCDMYYKITPPRCEECGGKTLINEKSKNTSFIQLLRIQQFLEDAKNSSPVEYDAEILGDKIGKAFIGQRKEFVAKFRSIPTKEYNKIVYEILEMRDLDQTIGCLPSDEELTRWKADPDIYDKAVNSLAPELYIKKEYRESCMMSIARGNTLNGKRNNIHTLFIGDAQLGKSELLSAVNDILIGSGKSVGTQASNAGLTAGMMKMGNGVLVPRGGLLPMHTGNLVCLDEVDKMEKWDREGILECMEQGTATLTKVGTSITLTADTTIIAAGNPKHGQFNPHYLNIMDNFDLESPFITRFDNIWLITDNHDEKTDHVINTHIREFKNNKENFLSVEEMQRYCSYVRTLTAIVPDELGRDIEDMYSEMRILNKKHDLLIGRRHYYGLYRMATAVAKLHLREIVTKDDLDIVKRIVFAGINSLKIDDHIKITPKAIEDNQLFVNIWRNCEDPDKLVDRNALLAVLANTTQFTEISAIGKFKAYEDVGRIELDRKTGKYRMHGK